MNWTELWEKGSTSECLGYSEALLWFFEGLPLIPSHPISFSQCYQVTVFFQGLLRALMFALMTIRRWALREVMGERMWHPFLPSGVLLLPERGSQRIQTNRRMASTIPLVPIILTYFLWKRQGRDWQHCLRRSSVVTPASWVTLSVRTSEQRLFSIRDFIKWNSPCPSRI